MNQNTSNASNTTPNLPPVPAPQDDNAHDLIPTWLAARIPALYSTEPQEGEEESPDPQVHAKFFTPDGQWTWYVTEYRPEEGLCFGLVNGWEPELGYFTLAELRSIRGSLGLRIERDLYWQPVPLSQVRAAIREGRSL